MKLKRGSEMSTLHHKAGPTAGKVLTAVFCLHILCVGVLRGGDAQVTLNFDHPTAPFGGVDLQWNNFGLFNTSTQPATSGYRIGTVSPNIVAYNGGGDPASINRNAGFILHSAYLTKALDVRVGFSEMHIRSHLINA